MNNFIRIVFLFMLMLTKASYSVGINEKKILEKYLKESENVINCLKQVNYNISPSEKIIKSSIFRTEKFSAILCQNLLSHSHTLRIFFEGGLYKEIIGDEIQIFDVLAYRSFPNGHFL